MSGISQMLSNTTCGELILGVYSEIHTDWLLYTKFLKPRIVANWGENFIENELPIIVVLYVCYENEI